MEKSPPLAKRSRKLFTLSAFYNACADLIDGMATVTCPRMRFRPELLGSVAANFPVWARCARDESLRARCGRGYIHSHGIALQALGLAGNTSSNNTQGLAERLHPLEKIDWSRFNAEVGRPCHDRR